MTMTDTTNKAMARTLAETDVEVAQAIRDELHRQKGRSGRVRCPAVPVSKVKWQPHRSRSRFLATI